MKNIDLNQVSESEYIKNVEFEQVLQSKGGNKAAIGRKLGNVSGQLIGQYVAGRQKPKEDFFKKWMKAYDEDIRFAFETNVSQNEIHEDAPSYVNQRFAHKLRSDRKHTVPFFDTDAAAGRNYTMEMTGITEPTGEIDVGDLLSDSDAAMRVYGNSMMQSYPPGCVIGLRKKKSLRIEPGSLYVIETEDERFFKRLFYADGKQDCFLCFSDNTYKYEQGPLEGKFFFPPFELPHKEVSRIWKVTGVIKRNSNSLIISR